jgi:hypothetical protein
MAITPSLYSRTSSNIDVLGQCWSFPLRQLAMLVVQLGQMIQVQAVVTIERPFMSDTNTAIQMFTVMKELIRLRMIYNGDTLYNHIWCRSRP